MAYDKDKSVMDNVKDTYLKLKNTLIGLYLGCEQVHMDEYDNPEVLIFEQLLDKDKTFLYLLYEYVSNEYKNNVNSPDIYYFPTDDGISFKEYITYKEDTEIDINDSRIVNNDLDEFEDELDLDDLESPDEEIDIFNKKNYIDFQLRRYILLAISIKRDYKDDEISTLLKDTSLDFLDDLFLASAQICNLIADNCYNLGKNLYKEEHLDKFLNPLNKYHLSLFNSYLYLLCSESYKSLIIEFDEQEDLWYYDQFDSYEDFIDIVRKINQVIINKLSCLKNKSVDSENSKFLHYASSNENESYLLNGSDNSNVDNTKEENKSFTRILGFKKKNNN